MSKVLFAICNDLFPRIFDASDVKKIADIYTPIVPPQTTSGDRDFILEHIPDAEIVITSWNTARLDSDVIAAAPKLRLLVHAAGSIKPVVSDALWDAGVRAVSAAPAIAVGVAEFTLGLMLTASKRAFWGANGVREGRWRDAIDVYGEAFEIYRQKIGIIGASNVGKTIIRLLKNFECDVLLFDPYCTEETANELGVTKVATLDELFSSCKIVSLHAPSTEGTKGMIRGRHLSLLPNGAVFINTARNEILNEPECIEEMRKGRFIACLDVTDPVEPCPEDHPYRTLPNVMLTPHIAGAVAENRLRLGALAADEIQAYCEGRPLKYEVKREQLSKIG